MKWKESLKRHVTITIILKAYPFKNPKTLNPKPLETLTW